MAKLHGALAGKQHQPPPGQFLVRTTRRRSTTRHRARRRDTRRGVGLDDDMGVNPAEAEGVDGGEAQRRDP